MGVSDNGAPREYDDDLVEIETPTIFRSTHIWLTSFVNETDQHLEIVTLGHHVYPSPNVQCDL